MMDINEKINYWKNCLLDLSKRNRLINCPLPNEGNRPQRNSLLISAPSSACLWSLLEEREDSLSFPLPSDFQMEQTELFEFESDMANSDIKTNQTQNETNKTLRSLMKKAKEFKEEKGLNALYLAFGFLNWKENGPEGQEMRSPLLLLPVRLSQEDLFSPIVLSRSDEEMTVNNSLEQKLLNDFNIELPPLTEDTALSDYLSDVSQAVKTQGWSVSDNVTQLSLFSFMKINMHRDLERNCEKICGHSIVRAINGEMFSDGINLSEIAGFDHDSSEPQQVFSVVDADSSQQDAILLAKRGASFILQGPPGTGKSQTITNIIAELIADGKKVLFVSEKMAALEVVYKRLTQVGLADFCLTLHSHNAKRREILDQFDKSIKMSRTKFALQQDHYNDLYRLEEERAALNRYNVELHTPIKPLGKTIFQINGHLAELENYRNIDFVLENVEAFTPEFWARCASALEEVARIVSKSGYQQNNPWNGCTLEQRPTFEFRQRFSIDAENLIALIREGLSILDETNEIFDNQGLDWCFSNIVFVKNIFDLAKLSPKVNPAWTTLDLQSAVSNLDACVSYIKVCETLENTLLATRSNSERISSAIQDEAEISSEQIVNKEIMNAVENYNKMLEARESLIEEKANLMTAREEAQEELLTSKQLSGDEKSKRDRAEADWQTAQNNLFRRCAEGVLSLDAANMLTRYRGNYRSWTRALSFAYHKDRKNLLAYCRMAEELTYEQGLMLLDMIANVQNLKNAFINQEQIAICAKTQIVKNESRYNGISEKLNNVTNDAAIAESKFNTAKNELTQIAAEVLSGLEQQLSEQKKQFPYTPPCVSLRQDLGIDIDENTDFETLRKQMEWCAEFQKRISECHLGRKFVDAVCERNVNMFEKADIIIDKHKAWEGRIATELPKFKDHFDEQGKRSIGETSLKQLLSRVVDCGNFSNLENLIDYRTANVRLKELGIDAYLNKAKEINLGADEIIPVFKKCFFRSLLDAVVPKYSAVSEFRRSRQDDRVESFKKLDKSHLDISKVMLISKLSSRLPNFDAYSSNGEIALLRSEMAKKRKLMPTRLLIGKLLNLLPALKPCMMMSPLSVSTYLGSSNFEFDAVIFDEASQVRTEDAIGAIFRAKQAIIVGDSKQLPPTDFFSSSMSASDDSEEDEEDENDDTGAYESLLDEATKLPKQTLRWHYRSRHESLIAFSNAKIYEGGLITFPSSIEKEDGMGVEYIYVSGGVYDRGGTKVNRAEAEKVAQLAFDHFQNYPNRSLGIIAFGEKQQSAIQDALIAKRRANQAFERFFKEDKEESLFIKNLETVQGDERDTIIFSIGYAPDAAGKFAMNFGPLNKDGGERRLNVAVTRARYNMKLVGSIMPTDIAVDRVTKKGPKLLRLYIDFAVNGAGVLFGEKTADDNVCFDSPFESSVYEFLTANGFDIATQVGCSGYRIDLAVRHPLYNGRFALGIECDGAMYHSARTARERDRLRQTVLEDIGWRIYRVWSTDWIKDRHTEGERLLRAARNAIDSYREIAPSPNHSTAKFTDLANISTQTAAECLREGLAEKSQTLRSYHFGGNAREIPTSDIENVMLKVITANFGLDKTELFKEAARFGYGWERQGEVIKRKFEKTYDNLIQQGKIEEDVNGKMKLKS